MIYAALVFAATTYQSLLGFDPPVFQAGKSQYEFYAQGDLEDGRRVVVYGFTPVHRGAQADVEHEIYVALLTRRGARYELASARRLMTDAVFNMGELGRFETFRAVVNGFTIGKRQYVDVTFWSSISGDTSQGNDVVFRIAEDGTLVIVAKVEGTEALERSAKQIRQTTSDVGVARGALVVTKHDRLASRDDVKKPFVVHCQTSKIAYIPYGHRMEESANIPKGKVVPLGRVRVKAVVPCCDGCQLPASTSQ